MSHDAVNWAWNCDLPCAQRMVLMVLGDWFHVDTPDACFPSHATIAAKAGLSRKHVITCLAELEKAGYISIYDRQRDNGGTTSCSYVLHMPSPKTPPAKADPTGFVYVASCDGATKVGITRDVESRLKGLRTANPRQIDLLAQFALPMRAARAVEDAVLGQFVDARLTGEWLAAPGVEVVAAVEAHIQDVVGGVSPQVTGGVSPEVTGGVTTGDMHNIDPINIYTPLPPVAPKAPALDVGGGANVHAILEQDLFEACCRISGHNRNGLDKRGGWFFANSVIERAKAELAGGSP